MDQSGYQRLMGHSPGGDDSLHADQISIRESNVDTPILLERFLGGGMQLLQKFLVWFGQQYLTALKECLDFFFYFIKLHNFSPPPLRSPRL